MKRMERIKSEIDVRAQAFMKEQGEDGSWRYCFEGPVMTDAYMIMTLRTLESEDEPLILRLAERISSKQEPNGAWKIFFDEEEGNLTATIEAYTALLFSGYRKPEEKEMKQASAFIREHGGLSKAGILTRAFLAMNGLYNWPRLPFNPAYLVLLPLSCPMNFYEFSCYARAHFAPVLLAAEHRFSVTGPWTPDIQSLDDRKSEAGWPEIERFLSDSRSSFTSLKHELYKWKQLPRRMLEKADRWIEAYILTRLESDGTFLSYASTTFLMIYGLMALGYQKQSPIIQKAVEGLKSLIWSSKGTFHLQNSPSEVWDTGLMSFALEEAGLPQSNPVMQKAKGFLLKKQQVKSGDWAFHNPNAKPGGWGFSDSDTFNPDIDDTQTALRTVQDTSSFQRGVQWLLSMQNQDGGWAAFEKNTDSYWLTLFPMKHIERAAIDPSSADLTGRTLEFLGDGLELDIEHPRVKAAVRWLKNRQNPDGTWYGRWGVCYIYGTWAALTGLVAAGLLKDDKSLLKGVRWLEGIQNKDGGWGESCVSDVKNRYVPLQKSTIVQTAWAIDALVSFHDKPNEVIERGVDYLLEHKELEGTAATYPVGAGLPGQFYAYYHGYPRYWPLIALAHYHNKYA